MNDSEFNDLVDETFDTIENTLEEMDMDLDSEQAEGVLTLECADGSLIILSRQSAGREIWLAARSGGYHLSQVDETWVCSKTSESLQTLLSRVFTEQTGKSVNFQVNRRSFHNPNAG